MLEREERVVFHGVLAQPNHICKTPSDLFSRINALHDDKEGIEKKLAYKFYGSFGDAVCREKKLFMPHQSPSSLAVATGSYVSTHLAQVRPWEECPSGLHGRKDRFERFHNSSYHHLALSLRVFET